MMNLGERWGIMEEPVTRFTFQAVLPYLLTLAWIWRNQPRRWPWVMAFTGALVYLHPVSTPAWALAIWLAMWLFIPASWSWFKQLGVMFANGLIMLLVVAWLALLGASVFGFIYDRQRPAWLAAAVLLISMYPLMFLVWHGNPMEIPRYADQIAVQFRLAGWMILALGLDWIAFHNLKEAASNGLPAQL